jgi:hypothetical protein
MSIWDADLRPDKCGVIFLTEARVRSIPVPHGNGGETTFRDIEEGVPLVWAGNCITREAFYDPLPVVYKFIYREHQKGHIVTLTYGDKTKVFKPRDVVFDEARYQDSQGRAHRDRLRRISQFKKVHALNRRSQ